jgi:SAM-dependent methyltransferase
MTTDYDPAYYEKNRAGSKTSAEIVVPQLIEWLPPVVSVVDIGCGEGWWGKAFEDCGANVTGVDGDYAEPVIQRFIPHDISVSIPPGKYDLALSLEVAEHLPGNRAQSFVADLCSLAPIVVFSAAIPGQGGSGHINEQWPSYWVEKFAEQGYEGTGHLRWQIWDDDRVEPWYCQNLLIFGPNIVGDGCPPVVHPKIWAWHTGLVKWPGQVPGL